LTCLESGNPAEKQMCHLSQVNVGLDTDRLFFGHTLHGDHIIIFTD